MLVGACAAGPSDGALPGKDPLQFGSNKHTTTFGQLDTQTVPDTVGRLSIVLGDVEGSNLAESVKLVDHKDEQTVLSTRNTRVGAKKSFEIDEVEYELRLLATDTTHIVHDSARFEFSLAPD